MKKIWDKCPRTRDIIELEKQVKQFLDKHQLSGVFSIEQIELWIYDCPLRQEDRLFNPILENMKNRTLKDLAEFDELFRMRLFPYIPQQALNGLSPVRYALNLKKLQA